MRPTLPSLIAVILACHHAPAPVTAGPPIPAEPEAQVDTMQKECDALITAFEGWKTCPNLDDRGRKEVDAFIEVAKQSFAAGTKAGPDEKSQHAIALACRRATGSVHASAQRCEAGKPPPRNY